MSDANGRPVTAIGHVKAQWARRAAVLHVALVECWELRVVIGAGAEGCEARGGVRRQPVMGSGGSKGLYCVSPSTKRQRPSPRQSGAAVD